VGPGNLGRFDVRQVVLALFRQMLGVPYPVAGLTPTRRLVVPELAVQGFDESYALSKRVGEFRVGLVFATGKIPEALVPKTRSRAIAGVATQASGSEKTRVGVVTFVDELPDQQPGIGQRFY
jgi:hypothetical protein